MIKITCGVCEKLLSIDETKLPMREVAFPCPLCKKKVELDRREIDPDKPETLRAMPASKGAKKTMDSPSADDGVGAAAEYEPVDGGSETGLKALIVGKANDGVAEAARSVGFVPVHLEEFEKARDWYLQEFPEVVFLCPAELGNPPEESVSRFLSMAAIDRRRGFMVLVGPSLRTLDGNAAFLYQVNLVVASADLGQFPSVYREARRDHDRLVTGFPGAEIMA